MKGANFTATALLVAGVTAGTYLLMHFVVAPHLPVIESEVPSLGGLTPEQARGLLQPRGLLLLLDGEKPDDRAPAGTLVDQRPLYGSRVRRGGDVHAFVATPPLAPRVPVLIGKTVEEARDLLVKARLRPGLVTNGASESVARGAVMACTPTTGTEVKADTGVDLVVSTGPDAGAVPSVLGKSKSKAKELLQLAGFVVGETRLGSNDDYSQGVVISQKPPGGAPAPKGTKIDLVIND